MENSTPRWFWVMAALAVVLLVLWGMLRFMRSPGSVPVTAGFVFPTVVEWVGPQGESKLLLFPRDPPLCEVTEAAGMRDPDSAMRDTDPAPLVHGTRVAVRTHGGKGSEEWIVETTDPAKRLALGILLDLNEADVESLRRIPNLGVRTARKIVQFRMERGSVESMEDLVRAGVLTEEEAAAVRPFVKAGP